MQAKAALAAALAGLCLSSAAVAADAYPSKPIRLIVPFAAGGTTDIVARIVSEGLTRELGQAVVVENRGGGGGSIGADALVRSTPDGYTLGVATVSTMATNPATNPQNPYNPIKDFTPITNLVNVPNVLTVNPSVPAKTLAEFITLLKNNPGKYSYASSGTGGISHLDGELFKSLTNTDMVHVPYRGSGPALNDVIAGQVNAQFDNLPSSMPHIQAGKLRALAIEAPKRLPSLPDVPNFGKPACRRWTTWPGMAWSRRRAPAGRGRSHPRRRRQGAEGSEDRPAPGRWRLAGGRQHAGRIRRPDQARTGTAPAHRQDRDIKLSN